MLPVIRNVEQLPVPLAASDLDAKLDGLLMRVREELENIHSFGRAKISSHRGFLAGRQLNVRIAHIDDLKNLLLNTKKVLKKDGLLIIENHYLGSVLKGNQFDTFYHEHPRTYSALSFIHIAKILALKLTDFKFTSRYGGNIRVFISNRENCNKDSLNKVIDNEKKTFKNLFSKSHYR